MLSPSLDVKGGISFVVQEYLKGGLKEKVDLHFIPTHKDGSHITKIGIFLVATCRFIALAPKMKHMIVHFHTSQNGSFFRKFALFCLAKLMGAKTVVHIHGSQFGTFMTQNILFRTLTQFYFDHADKILVMSKKWVERLSSFTENKNIDLLYNPVSLPKNKKQPHGDLLTILFMGRLGERKGIYDLLEGIVDNKGYFLSKHVKFILAGDGDIERVRQYVTNNQLTEFVEVPGWIANEQKESYLRSSDILILPSYNEQMPMSILEAMAHGCPIVATNIAGIPDMVEQGSNGFLFEPGDIGAMIEALKKLCEDRNMRKKMGDKSRQLVENNFENTKIVMQLTAIYKDIR
jgi:glycosyltransferase involved in cell wall biosynthesis